LKENVIPENGSTVLSLLPNARNLHQNPTKDNNENIYAAEYKLYLPEAKLLQQKLREWIAEEENK
jgi:hypothetical protein